ncbi:MAG: T9SS type A sorting domain-containing protein [Saprospiraceae bacterium]|nr:T9SS type A sorting domain-containing protein [Saprospiraceae bacterium]
MVQILSGLVFIYRLFRFKNIRAMRFLTLLLSIFGAISTLSAQIVTLDPAFPNRTEEVTITYDATQGSRGLVGVSQVYAHMGLIIEGKEGWQYVQGNWGTDDPKVKMTNIGNNKHTIKVKINEFYGVPANEKILQMTFVFRNVDGSKEGKTANNQDIYLPFSENSGELVVNFISPVEKLFVAAPGQVIPVKLQASLSSKIQVLVNDTLKFETTGTDLNYTLFVTDKLKKNVRVLVGEGDKQQEFSFTYIVAPDVVKEALPEGVKPGLNLMSKTSAIMVLTAPLKKYVHILGDFNDWQLDNNYALKQSPDEKYFWISVNLDDSTRYHTYQYLVDGKIRIADPFSTLVLDPNNDRFIPEETFPDLPAYPEGKATGYVSLIDTSPEEYTWSDQNFEKPKQERMVIYELLLRDFIGKRNYQTLIDTLDYLQNLGINAIEFMPVNEFEGNLSWGYNPSFHMALDKYYGTPAAFKALVDECHRRGIAVITDAVFNHAFGQSPLVQMYWDSNTGKPAASAIYANPDAKHPFNVGYDLNHESEYVKAFMDQVLAYWVNEYHIDGFRFDLSKGFTQNQSSDDGVFRRYDASRIAILKRMADELWKVDPQTYVILEHFAENLEEQELSNYGMMLWSNYNHAMGEAILGYTNNGNSDVNGLDYRRRSFTKAHQVTYMESHDEERQYYKGVQFGNTTANYSAKEKENVLLRIGGAATIFFGIPGPKMIWQFGELGYEYSINRCTNGTINNDCRLSEKPERWDYLDDIERYRVYSTFATMLQLRNTHEVFHTSQFTVTARDAFKQVRLDGDTLDVVMAASFELSNTTPNISFTHSGTWYELYSGQTVEVPAAGTLAIPFKAGEYRVYFDRNIMRPDITLDQVDTELSAEIALFPNPATASIYLELPQALRLQSYAIFDFQGKLVDINNNFSGNAIQIEDLNAGYYFIRLLTDKGAAVKAFVKQ